jgi:hypothetical protein
MGTLLSGAKARLICTGSAPSAAYLLNTDFWHMNGDVSPFSTEAGRAF